MSFVIARFFVVFGVIVDVAVIVDCELLLLVCELSLWFVLVCELLSIVCESLFI